MKGAGVFGVLFLAWQVVGTFFPEVSGGWGGFVFGCLGVFLAYKFLSQSHGPLRWHLGTPQAGRVLRPLVGRAVRCVV